jgi:hypothetical protein
MISFLNLIILTNNRLFLYNLIDLLFNVLVLLF